MNNLSQIFYCNVADCCFDGYGKIYPIKSTTTNNGAEKWRYINVGNKKISVSKLPKKLKIQSFDDFVFAYVFGDLCSTHPCKAMAYYVYKKFTNSNISLKQFYAKNK